MKAAGSSGAGRPPIAGAGAAAAGPNWFGGVSLSVLNSRIAAAPLSYAVLIRAASVDSSVHASVLVKAAGGGPNDERATGASFGEPLRTSTILPFTSMPAYSSRPLAGAEMPWPTKTMSAVTCAPGVDAGSSVKSLSFARNARPSTTSSGVPVVQM